MRRLLLALVLLAGTAHAAERRLYVSSFERLRVDGPFQVTVTTGRSPGAVVSADQPDAVEVRAEGGTIIVRRATDRWQEQPRAVPGGPVTVTLTTPMLVAASVIGGGQVTVTGTGAGGTTPRVDMSVAGAGAIGWTGANVEQANATVVGSGAITLAGRATRARIAVNGAGQVLADGLEVGDLTVLVDGPGEARARARYTASVTNTGLGRITVAGAPKCTVRNPAGGPVSCGTGAPAN